MCSGCRQGELLAILMSACRDAAMTEENGSREEVTSAAQGPTQGEILRCPPEDPTLSPGRSLASPVKCIRCW